MQQLKTLAEKGRLTPVKINDNVRYGSPVARASAVICIGQNYAAHAAESGAEPPQSPIVFLKTPNTIAGPNDVVTIARGSQKTDWEVELGIIIGSTASYCDSLEEAVQHIGGYVLANDLSERTFQLEISGGQWSKGKCSPGYMPLGPWIVTADEFDPADARLRSWVNGDSRQDSRTTDMIFSCAEIVRDLSQYMQLEPGDVISTGTPQGVAVSGRFPYLKSGDMVEVEIEGLGRQRQTYRAWEE
ncbi:fumarylacetoacetate hydrolase family protein [Halomonas sp. SpR1]|uniref:fumarylacetoacetate hydrolase family protein n=1 Tax=Halomonas sp. SpR1 TaxID=3050462 RepID=UPI0027E54906|nr:fumarylacetoacetate hydrolase family protein [Halomonas sp. SpR1]MDQ7731838.1 fumarylacetoacetate hydrolase family protein [Halomonas sp. SpR1]